MVQQRNLHHSPQTNQSKRVPQRPPSQIKTMQITHTHTHTRICVYAFIYNEHIVLLFIYFSIVFNSIMSLQCFIPLIKDNKKKYFWMCTSCVSITDLQKTLAIFYIQIQKCNTRLKRYCISIYWCYATKTFFFLWILIGLGLHVLQPLR